MHLDLTNKIAIVTGSSRGLGLASARALAQEGCRVCLCARTAERLEAARLELKDITGDANRVIAVTADVTTAAGIEMVMAATVKAFGGVDVLVNNVGTAGGAGLL